MSLDRILAEQRRAAAYLAENGPDAPESRGAALGASDWTHEEVERHGGEYETFIRAKMIRPQQLGFEVHDSAIHESLKPHQAATVRWMLSGGRRACFASFGLGKTRIQLEVLRLLEQRLERRVLGVIPLGVRGEFFIDAAELGTEVRFVRSLEECGERGIYLTNYETVRDGKLDPRAFAGASLDEASVLRGFGGTKTFREFMRLFDGMQYKFVATATPSPNEYIELLAYAAFLEVMDVGQAKTRFFKRDSTKADNLTLHPHKEREFWLWCASWALFIQKPSDFGFSDEGYELPEIDIHWHEIPSDHTDAGWEDWGQKRLTRAVAQGLSGAAKEKRDSLPARIEKMLELRALDPAAHRIIWHDLESERMAIERAIPGIATAYGSQDLEDREEIIAKFSCGAIAELATKPVIAGSGCNFQRYCSWAIFLGIGFKFNDFIQAIHRLHRFLQRRRVRIDLIYTESESAIRGTLMEKWERHNKLMAEMQDIIRKYGLSEAAMAHELGRALGVERVEASGEGWRAINNDCVKELRRMEDSSVHLVLTSIPFSTQYEYTPNYCDFGHTDDNKHFWAQMDFLVPELYRVLKPGRVAAIHVKDRIVPGSMTGLGFQTQYPFHCDAIANFQKHGFGFLGMKTIVTDVVRENNQTYRLGWSEQCKDGTKMGVGMSEYLLLFRRPPTERENSYADEPVRKSKPNCVTEDGEIVPFSMELPILPGTGYSRSRWQIDAHGFARSSGRRLLTPDELDALEHDTLFQWFRDYQLHEVYDYETHVRICEQLEGKMRLPTTFMLFQPPSWSDEVWSDITRMLSLNTLQAGRGAELHLCPMQFDIADRTINQFSQPGEIVLDPFAGLMSVPYRAVLLGRVGWGVELSSRYFLDGVGYLQAAERRKAMPTLFDLAEGA